MRELDGVSRELIGLAIREDIGSGDITTQATIDPNLTGSAIFLAREEFVVCGNFIAEHVFHTVDSKIKYHEVQQDGSKVFADEVIAKVSGPIGSILTAERTALNFMQRLSGISTLTAQVISQAGDTTVKILDTRKTTPGWRTLEKYAVKIGGGVNHRKGLFDAVLIKNNHIDVLAGDISLAITKCREQAPSSIKIQIEVRNRNELEAALMQTPDSILLDNMSPQETKESVDYIRKSQTKNIEVEASGGIDLKNIKDYAQTGVNYISLGMLTHSVRAVDISLRLEKPPTR